MIRVDSFERWRAEWRKEHDFVGLKRHELRHAGDHAAVERRWH